jgi:hypothetical protein
MASHGFAFRSKRMQNFCIPGTRMQKNAERSIQDMINRSYVLKTDPQLLHIRINLPHHLQINNQALSLILTPLLSCGKPVQGLEAHPSIRPRSRMPPGFQWALAFSAKAQPLARTTAHNSLPRSCGDVNS